MPTVPVVPESLDYVAPAEVEVTAAGMYLTVGNVVLDLETSSSDADEQIAALTRATKALTALADAIGPALSELAATITEHGVRCPDCDGAGGREHGPFSKHDGAWEHCPHCAGSGRLASWEVTAA